MTQASPYRNASKELLVKARQELAEGDSRQASEKAWGAAAQMVKAVSESRGWPHDSHSLLYQAIDRLVRETGNRQIFTLFGNAGNLHVNFYENWQSSEMVASGIQDVELFLNELDSLLYPSSQEKPSQEATGYPFRFPDEQLSTPPWLTNT